MTSFGFKGDEIGTILREAKLCLEAVLIRRYEVPYSVVINFFTATIDIWLHATRIYLFLKRVSPHLSNYMRIVSVVVNPMLQQSVAQLQFIAVVTRQGTALQFFALCFE